MHTTNYQDFIVSVAPDCSAKTGIAPKASTAAGKVLLAVREEPYRHLSDDLIFGVFCKEKVRSGALQGKPAMRSKRG